MKKLLPLGKNQKKILAPFGGFILVLLGVASFSLTLRTPSAVSQYEPNQLPQSSAEVYPSSEWQIYTDSISNISVEIPSEWILQEGVYVYPNKEYWEIYLRKSYEWNAPWITLGVWENSQQLSSEEWIWHQFAKLGIVRNSFENQPIFRETVISGIPSLEIDKFINGGVRTVFVPYQQKMYEITLGAGSPDGGVVNSASPEDMLIFEHLLQSLRFLE